jgi:hypothetical protein
LTSNHSINNLVIREPAVGEGQVEGDTEERYQGGARGGQKVGQEEPCVAILENCDDVVVEDEGTLFEEEKVGRVLVGPRGLDYRVQNMD